MEPIMARAVKSKPANPPTSGSGTVYLELDPNEVELGPNPRGIEDVLAERPDLVASIRANGVLVPLMAERGADGAAPLVWDGQCRLLVARELGLTSVGVVVTDSRSDDLQRMVEQWATAQDRADWSLRDKALALEQMVLFSDVDTVATRLRLDPREVRAAARVRDSAIGEVVAEVPQMTLIQLAAFDEFAGDEEAVSALLETLVESPEQFDHEVSAHRHRVGAEAKVAEKVAELTAAGVNVVEPRAAGSERLFRLAVSAQDATGLTEDNHTECPGHAASVDLGYRGEVQVEWLCADWRGHGHHDQWAHSGTRGTKGPRSEHEKGEAKRARANNAAWRAALDVRRDKLAELIVGKPANQVLRWVLRVLAHGGDHVTDALRKGSGYATSLLGLPDKLGKDGSHPIVTRAKRANQDDLLRLLLGTLLGGMESRYSMDHTVDTWRRPTSEDKLYFTVLEELGYTTATVERLVLDPAADRKSWPHLIAAATATSESTAATVEDSIDTATETAVDPHADASAPPADEHDVTADTPGAEQVDAPAPGDVDTGEDSEAAALDAAA
jgi:ParB family chromosome partitioning protein